MRLKSTTSVLILVVGGACSSSAPREANGSKLNVVSTVSPITNIVDNVGGNLIELTGLVPEGVNSHTFEPAPSDAKILSDADVVFMNGLHLEEPTRMLAEANTGKDTEIVALGDRTISRNEWIFDFSFPAAEEDPNPHLWTNPRYGLRYSEIMRDVLSKADPANAQRYGQNQAEFARKLDAFSEALSAASATVPAENRKLLTYHDSFPYFARDYGWAVIGAIQPSDFSEPTAREVAILIDQVRREQVPAIFGSEVFPSPVLEQIARETGAKYVDDLRDDDLPGAPKDPEHSYLGLMRFDFRTIVEALGGDASEFKDLDVSNIAGAQGEYRT